MDHQGFSKGLSALSFISVAAVIFSVLALPSRLQAQDLAPPTLTAFDYTPTSIDTGSGPATVKVTYSAIDDLSGLVQVWAYFISPSGLQIKGNGLNFPTPIASTTGSFDVNFPRYSETGVWTVYYFSVLDAVGRKLAPVSTVRTGDSGVAYPTTNRVARQDPVHHDCNCDSLTKYQQLE
jgi:hypothetical protein